eukprot:CAMPEP_0116004258 /NCGR_PEP_ID=MMETSP0321-20121206/502_1 /TAXON_ID=163516 /ORGANISM="Leptocylindrus danicus var. danicus, Strain B650" /LENGTH=1022 /DNA_ID=CAMNT_0003472539 /DNA_START=186 /DNA_END=3255 /DNA_ORIENTATION=-
MRGSKSGAVVVESKGSRQRTPTEIKILHQQIQKNKRAHESASADGGMLGAACASQRVPQHSRATRQSEKYANAVLSMGDDSIEQSEAYKLQRKFDLEKESREQKNSLSFSKANGGQRTNRSEFGRGKKYKKKGTKIVPGGSIQRSQFNNRSGESISSGSTMDISNQAVFEASPASHEGGYYETLQFVTEDQDNNWGNGTRWRGNNAIIATAPKRYNGSSGQGSNYASSSGKRKSYGVSSPKFYEKKITRDEDEEYQEPKGSKKSKHKFDVDMELTPRRRSTRNKKKKKENEVISLLDSSSDEEVVDDNDDKDVQEAMRQSLADSQPKEKKVGMRPTLDVVRIAIGKKVFSSGCKMQFQTVSSKIHLEFRNTNGDDDVHVIEADHISEVKYFWSDDSDGRTSPNEFSEIDDQLPFIAMRVQPTTENRLGRYSSSYVQIEKDGDNLSKKWYIVVELRSVEDFKYKLDVCKESCEHFQALFCDEARLTASNTTKYTTTLREDDRQLTTMRITRGSKKKSKKHKSGTDDEKVLLVYPFQGSAREIEDAADGLEQINYLESWKIEAVIVDASVIPQAVNCDNVIEEELPSAVAEIDVLAVQPLTDDTPETASVVSDGDKATVVVPSTRSHFLTIRNEDLERLEQGEFLNDTLVDFWMQWIWRKEPAESKVHFFTSHFFTTLQENDVQGVSSWTVKKGIDIFEKSFIFLPINEHLHWSLCVIVNPGEIMNSCGNHGADVDGEMLVPCIIFLDSLKAHRSSKVAQEVRRWLNFEWKRSDHAENSTNSAPFTKKKMRLFTPKIPYQDNSWDCGVFVCRYAYALYTMYLKGVRIRQKDIRAPAKFKERKILENDVITKSVAFDFDMPEIRMMRDDMKKLVTKLSRVYLKSKETPNSECQGNANDSSSENKLSVHETRKSVESRGACTEFKFEGDETNNDKDTVAVSGLEADNSKVPKETKEDGQTENKLEAEITQNSIKPENTHDENNQKAEETDNGDEDYRTAAGSGQKDFDMLTVDNVVITGYSQADVV